MEYLTKAEAGKTKIETTKYLHGPGVDAPMAVEREKEAFYYHADGLGSIAALTDQKQKAVESYEYTSFGELKRQGDKVKNTYTFTAREWDKEIDLYYYRARYYDAGAGRLISKDPILHPENVRKACCGGCGITINTKTDFDLMMFNPLSLSPYVYVMNNPVRFKDPTGEKCYTANQLDKIPPEIKDKIPPGIIDIIKKPCWEIGCLKCCAGVLVESMEFLGLCVECKF